MDNTTHEGMQPLWSWLRIDEEMEEQYKAHGNSYQFIWVRYLMRKMAEDYEVIRLMDDTIASNLRERNATLTDQLREAERQLADLQERDELLVKRTHENTIDLVEENRQLKVERDELTDQLREARATKDELISVVQLAYRKHHLEDSRIGWDELSDRLLDALSNAMGAEELVKWQEDNNDE